MVKVVARWSEIARTGGHQHFKSGVQEAPDFRGNLVLISDDFPILSGPGKHYRLGGFRRMGFASRNPSTPAFVGDGFRFALPILRGYDFAFPAVRV